MSTPASQRAEESVIGALMRSNDARLEVLGSGLESEHFHFRPYRMCYEAIVERFYADEAIDPLLIAEVVAPAAARGWQIEERAAVDKLVALASPDTGDPVTTIEHAKIIRRHADYRELLAIASRAVEQAAAQDLDPGEIAGTLSAASTRVVTGAMRHSEILSYADLGRRWMVGMQDEIAAKAAGSELGAYFALKGVDDFVKGMRPTELMILGGPPGVGKSGLAWVMGRNFAVRQLRKDPDRRVGCLILSLEMGESMSSSRFAQVESGVEGETLRTVAISRERLRTIASQWATNRELPLYLNHSGELRESQIRALVVDAIRRHNVGLVIVDHFRFIKTDERFEKQNEADDQIVKFLKATLAKDLNLAVICLAHTTKGGETARRPVMDDLRGSGMISAFADLVAFLYSPWKHATQERRDQGLAREDFELIFEKVRQGAGGTGALRIDMSTMRVD
jgi:replicative DNA helicase